MKQEKASRIFSEQKEIIPLEEPERLFFAALIMKNLLHGEV